jgi:hypothetical protein
MADLDYCLASAFFTYRTSLDINAHGFQRGAQWFDWREEVGQQPPIFYAVSHQGARTKVHQTTSRPKKRKLG